MKYRKQMRELVMLDYIILGLSIIGLRCFRRFAPARFWFCLGGFYPGQYGYFGKKRDWWRWWGS